MKYNRVDIDTKLEALRWSEPVGRKQSANNDLGAGKCYGRQHCHLDTSTHTLRGKRRHNWLQSRLTQRSCLST